MHIVIERIWTAQRHFVIRGAQFPAWETELWRDPVSGETMGADDFDGLTAVYLTADDETGCLRLLPARGQHMIARLWPQIVAPQGADVWELTRLYASNRKTMAALMSRAVAVIRERGGKRLVGAIRSELVDRFRAIFGADLEVYGELTDGSVVCGGPVEKAEMALANV